MIDDDAAPDIAAREQAISRRQMLITLAAAGVALAGTTSLRARAGRKGDAARLKARPRKPVQDTATPGEHALGLDTGRDGFLFVPASHRAGTPAPLLVMLHGATQNAQVARKLIPLVEELGIVMLAPESRGMTWDVVRDGFGPDVAFIDRALEQVFDTCTIDPHHLALGGFSDGASYALSLGLTNGDLFSHLLAFSPGFMAPEYERGRPKIFVGHGTSDQILPIEQTSRVLVPKLKRDYSVNYIEFAGPHTIDPDEARTALKWFLA
jgi:phospholipase/carboxylesterase